MLNFITVSYDQQNHLSVMRLINAAKIKTGSIESVKLLSKNLTKQLGKELYVWSHELQILTKEDMVEEDNDQLRLIISGCKDIVSSIKLATEITEGLGIKFITMTVKVKDEDSVTENGITAIVRGILKNTEEFAKLLK